MLNQFDFLVLPSLVLNRVEISIELVDFVVLLSLLLNSVDFSFFVICMLKASRFPSSEESLHCPNPL